MTVNAEARAALLIDWDNLNGALRTRCVYEERDIARGLIDRVKATSGMELLYKGVFAPGTSFQPDVSQALRNGRLTVIPTLSGKNAADLRIATEACSLMHTENCRYFVIVTGDADFVPLYEFLEDGGSEVHIWVAHPEQRLRGPLRDLAGEGRVEYVSELLELDCAGAQLTPETLDVLLLLYHRMAGERDIGLWSWPKAVAGLDGYKVLQVGEIESGIKTSVREQRILETQKTVNGRLVKDRSTNFENPSVAAFFKSSDRILADVGWLQKTGDASLGRIIERNSDGSPDDVERIRGVVASLVRAGFLVDQDGGASFTLGQYEARLGLMAALRRIVFAVLSIQKQRGWKNVTTEQVGVRWGRTYSPGHRGQLPPAEQKQAHTEAHHLLRRARYEGLVVRQTWKKKNGETVTAWRVRQQSPFVRGVVGRAKTVLEVAIRLQEQTGSSPHRDDVIESVASLDKAMDEADARVTLSQLAAETCVNIVQGRVSLPRDSKRYEWVLRWKADG